jgi:hypothetical protein
VLRILAVLLGVSLLGTFATAQIPAKGNIFLGYSYGRVNFSSPITPPDTGSIVFSNPANLNGWNGSLEGKVLPFVGIVADLSGYYGSPGFTATCGLIIGCVPTTGHANATVYNVLFGPRLSVSVGKLRPFAHALVGVAHVNQSARSIFSNSATSFADAIGGGIDYRLIPLVAWRVQADFLQTRFFSATQDNFRFSTGLVLRF